MLVVRSIWRERWTEVQISRFHWRTANGLGEYSGLGRNGIRRYVTGILGNSYVDEPLRMAQTVMTLCPIEMCTKGHPSLRRFLVIRWKKVMFFVDVSQPHSPFILQESFERSAHGGGHGSYEGSKTWTSSLQDVQLTLSLSLRSTGARDQY